MVNNTHSTSTAKFLAADFLKALEPWRIIAGTMGNSLKKTAKISHVVPLLTHFKK